MLRLHRLVVGSIPTVPTLFLFDWFDGFVGGFEGMARKQQGLPQWRNLHVLFTFKDRLLDIADSMKKSRVRQGDRIFDVLVGFFIFRKLVQDKHVATKTGRQMLEVFRCNFNDALVAEINKDANHKIETRGAYPTTYSRTSMRLPAKKIAEKFVHAGYCVPLTQGDENHEFLVLEEEELDKRSYEEAIVVPVDTVSILFHTAATDNSDAINRSREDIERHLLPKQNPS